MIKNYLLLLVLYSSCLLAQTQPKDSIRPIDSLSNSYLDEVVVSASRTPESILKSPVTIENVSSRELKNSAAPSFFDGLENVKGVQMLTPSLGFKIINTRGFANTTNVRFTQMVDGFDNQAPHIGAPIGNAMGPTDLDIERVEIIPGTASALYGLNAINGLANFITKDPFTTTGIMVQQKTGMNHIGDADSGVTLYSESALRIAEKINDRFAFKVNFAYTGGQDWIANNTTDLNPNANAGVGIAGGVNNPAFDPVNGYGNESSNRRTLTLGGTRYVVARTGYAEKDVADYGIQNIKADVGLYYKLSPKTTISYTYRFADLDNVYQRANRFTLKDYILQQHAIEVKNDIFQVRAFATSEDTGKSYNLRSAAENLDRQFKSDNDWYADYSSAFNTATAQGSSVQQALAAARAQADLGRLQPGTPEFKQALNELADINNWDEGAALRVKDWLVHSEAQVNLSKAIGGDFETSTGLQLLAGADYQSYIIKPDGNYFMNPTATDPFSTLTYGKTGSFIQAGKTLFEGLLKLSATLRVDKNDYFDVKYNPRVAAVFTPAPGQSIRASFQSGSRFPSIFEAFSNVNSGGVRRVGGLRVMSDGVFENGYLRSSIDRFQAAVTNDFNNGATLDDAIQNNQNLLQKNTQYTYLKPEQINSFEAGYKGLFFNRSFKVDADFYFNRYNNFIAQIEMNVPQTTDPAQIPYYMNDRSLQDRYRIYTNSQSVVYNYGASLGLSYLITDKYSVNGNVSYAKLSRTDNGDGFEDGFNTPEWIGNISFTGDNVWKTLGFNVTYKRQSSFYWRSFLVNGDVKAYGTLDAQVNYTFLQSKLGIKVGATNLTNAYYNSFLGGPAVGGLYYTTLTYQLQ
jgi:iron complex outermembrane receptor protein